MASGIFAVLDDIAALMDDVAMASKVAAKNTAGILGDDLAVNADKATGFVSSREIPVLWAITKGSFLNKLIIIPIALLLNYFLPVAISIILVMGGLYLSYEGMEKIIHFIFHRNEKPKEIEDIKDLEENENRTNEKAKIKDAVSTDFILSVEIVIIALGSVLDQSLAVQIMTVIVVSILATVGVYGIVALIVRMDDTGYRLIKRSKGEGWRTTLGKTLIKSLPVIIRVLGIVGTIALILVAGGIFAHNIGFIHHYIVEHLANWPSILPETILGIVGGLLTYALVTLYKKIKSAVISK